MHWFHAVILGIVEGLTEFVPVSSTGHLIIVSDFLKLEGATVKVFEIFIQLGAICAVLGLYRQKFLNLMAFKKNVSDDRLGLVGWNGIFLLILTTVPALFLGALLHDFIKRNLFSSAVVAVGLCAGAILMIFAEKLFAEKLSSSKSSAALNARKAFAFGCFQCLALWPGMSRSASTIAGGLFLGMNRQDAAEYSFFAAFPVILAAVLFDTYKSRAFITASDVPLFVVGFVVSFLFAWLSIKFFIQKLNQWTLVPFAYYRIILAALIFLRIYC